MEYSIGIDLGGTNVKMVAVTSTGKALHTERFQTNDDSAATWAPAVAQKVAAFETKLGPAQALGVSSPGLAARDGRSIAWMQGRLAAVQGFDWTAHLKRRVLVPVLNDAHAALLGEAWLGAAAAKRNVIMLTLGTGVGGAILCDGHLLRGHLGRAGHLGHISLDPSGTRDIVNTPGSLEDAIGECTLPQRSQNRYANTAALVMASNAGDPAAQKIWLTSVKALAAALASLINALDPELIVLGGGIAQAGPALFQPLQQFLAEFEWHPTGVSVPLVTATLGDLAGALGAAHHALHAPQ